MEIFMKFYEMFLRDKQGQPVEACELYAVRWTARDSKYNSNTKPEIMVFTSRNDAEEFACAIRDAFSLIKHTGAGTSVTVSKQGGR